MRFPAPPLDDNEAEDTTAPNGLPPVFPESGLEIAVMVVAWVAMASPILLLAAFRTGHVVASIAAVKLIFELSSWACWLTAPLTVYAAWKRPTLLHGATILAALVGIYLHLSLVSITPK